MVLHIRVDERLAHGQVCAVWVKYLDATHILIANDTVANDSFQKKMMSIGIPNTVKYLFATVDKAIDIINDPKAIPLRILVVVKTPADAVIILNHVEGISDVVFGSFGTVTELDKTTSRNICQGVVLDDENTALVKNIKEKIKKDIFYQGIPTASPVKLNL